MFPKQNNNKAILAIISRESFINNTINGDWFKKQQEPQKQQPKQQINKNKIMKRRESQYVLERGRWRKRYPRL